MCQEYAPLYGYMNYFANKGLIWRTVACSGPCCVALSWNRFVHCWYRWIFCRSF